MDCSSASSADCSVADTCAGGAHMRTCVGVHACEHVRTRVRTRVHAAPRAPTHPLRAVLQQVAQRRKALVLHRAQLMQVRRGGSSACVLGLRRC